MRKLSKQKGFTLIEMIVSLGIFAVVALVAVGALLKVTEANRKSISLKTTINNLNFALESMSRELKVGSNYICAECNAGSDGKSAINQDWILTFNSSKKGLNNCPLKYSYQYIAEEKTIKKAEEHSCDEGLTYYPLISKNIDINNVTLNLDNSGDGSPRIFLFLNGSSGIRESDKTEFSIQTTISQRLPK